MTAIAPAPAARTFQPLQNVVAREVHGERVAAKLECGHVVDTLATAVAASCPACRPIEVARG